MRPVFKLEKSLKWLENSLLSLLKQYRGLGLTYEVNMHKYHVLFLGGQNRAILKAIKINANVIFMARRNVWCGNNTKPTCLLSLTENSKAIFHSRKEMERISI